MTTITKEEIRKIARMSYLEIHDDEIELELYEPKNALGKTKLSIKTIIHVFRPLVHTSSSILTPYSSFPDTSDSCSDQVDINCSPEGDDLCRSSAETWPKARELTPTLQDLAEQIFQQDSSVRESLKKK